MDNKDRIYQIAQKLQNIGFLNTVGATINANGITTEEFYKTMKNTDVGMSSVFGNNVYNAIDNQVKNTRKELTLPEILDLVNEMSELIKKEIAK